VVDPRLHRQVPEGSAQHRSAAERHGGAARPSLDSYIDEDGDVSHLERIEDEGPGPEGTFLGSEGDGQVRDALGKVRKRIGELGWDIVHNRLQQDSPKTLEEIGKRWGVSRERVRQVELKTKQFLHRYLESVESVSSGQIGRDEAAQDAA
jgi:RNA polymerase primary sigma factor